MTFNVNGLEKLMAKLESWANIGISSIPNIVVAIVLIFLMRFLGSRISRLVRKSLDRSRVNQNLRELIDIVVKITFMILGIILALGVLNLQKAVFSMIAGVGVMGLALGFAFQDIAANFMAGVMLAIRSPFNPGDVVKINDIIGTVRMITLRETLIRDFDGNDVFVPNKDFLSNDFTNYAISGVRKFVASVGISYDNDQFKAKDLILSTVNKLKDVLEEPAPAVYLDQLGDSSVNFNIHAWIKYPGGNILEVKSNLLCEVKRELESNGFSIPYPIRTLDIPKGLFQKPNSDL